MVAYWEIVEVLHESRCSVTNALRKLYQNGEIMRKEVYTRNSKGAYLWKIKD